MTTPEQRARLRIDELLAAAGWSVQDLKQADLNAARGVAIREFELNAGFGTADYLLYVDGKAAGFIEAKKVGVRVSGVGTMARLLDVGQVKRSGPDNEIGRKPAIYPAGGTFLARLRHMPPLAAKGLWPAPINAIGNLGQSLKGDRPVPGATASSTATTSARPKS